MYSIKFDKQANKRKWPLKHLHRVLLDKILLQFKHQISGDESLQLLDDPRATYVDEVANKVGVQKIGWILTDLVAEDLKLGTVRHLRHRDTYYVSAEECIMAADFQNRHPNVCKLSPTNKFGSKFVTVIVTGWLLLVVL